MTQNEKRVVMAVFSTLLEEISYKDLNKFLGSITIEEMASLYYRLKYEDYCTAHGISYDEMTEDDFVQAYEQEQDAKEAMSYINDDSVTGSWDDEWF